MLDIGSKSEAAKKWTFIVLLGCALSVPAFALAQGPAIGIVVFGDSLSDPGNAFTLVGGTNTPPDYSVDFFLVPDQPYARGGHHFSNGPTWIEQLANSQGLAVNAQPAFRGANPSATNYAIGGARARDDGRENNLSHQVGRFLQDFGGAAPAGALYVVEIGGNDIRDFAATGFQDSSIIPGALSAVGANIGNLYNAGARKFLVWNAPKLAVTPAIRRADVLFPGTAFGVDAVTVQYNIALEGILGALAGFPGIQIVRFNAYDNVAAIYANGAAFGLSDVNDPCITPNVAPFFCQNPDDYLFWDGIHPTKAVHSIIAHEVAQLLAR
jgi:phospholipase/lecithinase/hemolysin